MTPSAPIPDAGASRLLFPQNSSEREPDRDLGYLEDLRVITDAMGAAVTRCSRSLRYVWVNGHYAEWHGLTPEQMIGRSFKDVIGDEAFEETRPFWERALLGERVEYEKKLRYKTRNRWIHAIYTPTFGSDGIPDGWVSVLVDVDERDRAEESLRQQNLLLTKLNEVGKFLVQENGLEDALQLTLDAVIEATHADFGTFQLFDERTKYLRIAAQKGFNSEFLEYFSAFNDSRGTCGRVKESKERVIVQDVITAPILSEVTRGVLNRAGVRAVHSTPLIGRTSELLGVVTVHFRTTHEPEAQELQILDLFARQTADLIEQHRIRARQKQDEEAILRASEAKDVFLAMLGHELRNPLTPITIALELLSAQEASSRQYQIIRRQVRHLTRLVDDLLDAERFARGKIDLRRECMEIRPAIMSAIETTAPALESKRHELKLEVPDSGLVVHGDAERLRQVFSNLLNNAARYTPAGGHIHIRGYREGTDVVVQVVDDGDGIDPKLLPHVFELFTERPRSIDRREGGLGLGLAIVKSIVKAHHGRAFGESEGIGKGSRFTIRLPFSSEAPASDNKLPEPLIVESKRSLRILLVEDNADVAETVVAGLRLAGHEVESAADGPAALALLSEFSPEVALLDLGLPVMDGYELAARIADKQRGHEPIMIALSGYGQPADFRKSRDAGFHLHLVKPIKLELLLSSLSALPIP